MDRVELWTDGACSGNPGPGGWAAILRFGETLRELTGSEPQTTNNRMELAGAIAGLEALTRPVEVHLFTDSAYLARALTEGWIERWRANGWKTAARKPVENRDLWERLIAAAAPHRLVVERVDGHAGVGLNDRADELAVAARIALAP